MAAERLEQERARLRACPISGCTNETCEPVSFYVCDDDYAVISANTRRWVERVTELAGRASSVEDGGVRDAN